MSSLSLNIFRAAFLADSLSLGSHWVYNQEKLQRLYPEGCRGFDDPQSKFHPNRRRGQFTHYGDQMVMLAKAVAASPRWSLASFRGVWESGMSTYDGYLDGASKATLANLRAGKETPASDSDDLAGASRCVPVLFSGGESLAEKVTASREQTALTHDAGTVIDGAEFFVRAIVALQEGLSISEALQQAADENYRDLKAGDFLKQARQALGAASPREVAADFGLTCHFHEAFPLALYFALRSERAGESRDENAFLTALSENALAGGDTSARAIPLAAMLAAAGWRIPESLWEELVAFEHLSALETLLLPPEPFSQKVTFQGAYGDQLDARLELPADQPRAYAIFAHCFSCGKAAKAATYISRALARKGIATLRFDFTGLGSSEGDFANTSFLSNVEDLVAAANHLRDNFSAPSLLLGHSLGGAAALAAASQMPELTHVVTLAAPFDPHHVTRLFEDQVPEIREKGQAEVDLGGRRFSIGERFLTDLESHNQEERIVNLGRSLLIMHSPTDAVVEIENAGRIYSAAKHPKSFVALEGADHLLTDLGQARYAANVIASWS
jgi:putative redox protein